jgi:Copper amine oxidase N-terminal domain
MNPAAVVVILNGAILASAPPAQLLFGHVMAPVAPVVTHFTQRAAVDGDTITLVRQGRTCTFRIGSDAFDCDGVTGTLPVAPFGRDGVAYLPLADVARAFGGAAAYDPHTRILALDVPPAIELKTPAPFDPSAPSATPTVVFTPSPSPATPSPRPADTPSPLPRRTAIPAIPSRGPSN